MGDRAANLGQALRALWATPGIFPGPVSSVYLTEPVGFSSPHWFYNLVAIVRTSLSPWELVLRTLEIERQLGRVRKDGLKDRVVDIDILFYGEEVIRGSWLEVPHPRLHQRAFVLVPLCELVPEWRHPLLGHTVQELLEGLPEGSRVYRLGPLVAEVPGR